MKKGILLSLLILFITICSLQAADSLDIRNNKKKENLLRQLSRTEPDDTLRLSIYRELYHMARGAKTEEYYLDKLIEESELQKHDWYRCRAYLYQMNRAYNQYDVKRVNYWMTKLEPVAQKAGLYDFLFLGKRCVIDMLLVKGEYELEEKEATKMLQSARKLRNDLGIILANQCLSNVYRMTYRYEEATVVLQEAYAIAARLDDPLVCEINNALVAVYEGLNDDVNWLKWIKTMDDYLQKQIRRDPEMENRYRGWLQMTAISYVKYYTAVKDYARAGIYLEQMDKYRIKGSSAYDVNYHYARLDYFKESGQLEHAVIEIDSILSVFKNVSLLSYINTKFMKADLLAELGREGEAITIYQQSFAVSDSANVNLVNKQSEQLKQDYDADTLFLKKEQNSRNQRLLLLGLAVVAIVVLFVFVFHAYRVQRKLRQSEDEMRRMAEAMNLANVAKENFLATISSSISEPLNTVVSGALQLATDEVTDKQMRQLISENLSKTSAELMELINSILNLSKLEAGMMKFRGEDVEIHSFVLGVLAMSTSNGLVVKSELADEAKTAKVHFEIARLYEIFNYLLVSNTSSGELSLNMQLADAGKSLSFTVQGSLLAAYPPEKQSQKVALTNEVSRLLVEHFGGRYEVKYALSPQTVCFILPIV